MSEESLKPQSTLTEKAILRLAESFGLSETDEMRSIREAFISAEDRDEFLENLNKYLAMGEQSVDKLPDELRSRGQIGLFLAQAGINYRVGLLDNFRDSVEDAILLAHSMGYVEIVDHLEKLLEDA